MIVQMQFGDGSFKEIEVEATNPDEAVSEARDWVKNNAWFEIVDENTDADTKKTLDEKSRGGLEAALERLVGRIEQAESSMVLPIRVTDAARAARAALARR